MDKKRNRKIRVAVAGCGRFSEQGHLVPYFLHPQAEIVAVCDLREDVAKKAASRYRVRSVHTDFEKMLDVEKPDAVSICTPTFTHADLTVAAAARGVNVFCEKPMSPSPQEGERMIAACRDAGIVLHVGYHKRCDRGLRKLKELLDGNYCGECFQADIEWSGLSTFGNVPFVNRMMELSGMLGVSTESFSPGWRFNDPRCPGGVFEVICHEIDLAIWLFGPPESVEGEIRVLSPDCERPDHAVILLKNSKTATTYITMSRNTLSLKEEDRGLFRCKRGNISFSTNGTRQAFLPAKLTVQTGEGLFGRTRTMNVPPVFSAVSSPHYRKINNFFLEIDGELPAVELPSVCHGEDALETDKVVAHFVNKL